MGKDDSLCYMSIRMTPEDQNGAPKTISHNT